MTEEKGYAPQPVTISIAPGRYYEKLSVSQPNLTLEGAGADSTILTYDDYALQIMEDGIKRGTFRTYTLFLDAQNISLKNLTVENAAGPGKKVGHDWGKAAAHDTVYFAEYNNFGPGAAGTRPAWTHTLTDAEAVSYTYSSVFCRI